MRCFWHTAVLNNVRLTTFLDGPQNFKCFKKNIRSNKEPVTKKLTTHHRFYVLHFFLCVSLSVTMSICVKYVQYCVYETVMNLAGFILDLH